VLRLDGVRARLGGFALSVDGRVPAGGRVALLGASGSGKSTLLSLVAGFLWPDRGRLTIDGTDVTRKPVSERPVSILFQDGNLFPHLSVFDNVAVGLRPGLDLTGAERARVDGCLTATGLGGMGARFPRDLSGGQRSRIALARVFLRRAPVVLLDEPFAALDPSLRRDMLILLEELADARGSTLLMATHDFRDAERLCDRLWMLADGQLALDRPMAGLRATAPDILHPWL